MITGHIYVLYQMVQHIVIIDHGTHTLYRMVQHILIMDHIAHMSALYSGAYFDH